MRNLLLLLLCGLWLLACGENEIIPREYLVDRDTLTTENPEKELPKDSVVSDTVVTDTVVTDTVPTDTIPADTIPQDTVKTPEPEQHDDSRLKVIFDTDIAEDCDDVGAMAVLHALADRGELDILGMMVSMPVDYGAPALDAINTYFNRPNIPIGTLKNSQDAIGAKNLDVYNKALATQFPNDLKHASNTPNALDLYRKLLAGQPDNSVVIITVGPLTNLYHLMRSSGDQYSSLNGMDLIRKKVKRFIMAGGKLPEGTSYNFRVSPEKSEYVVDNWPTEHWLVPNELGDGVFTGPEMLSKTTKESPIHVAYSLYKTKYPTWEFRPSWDQMGVYIAARPNDRLFKTNTTGYVDGSNAYIIWKNSPDKNHVWFQSNSTREERRRVIEGLMMHTPR